MKDQFETTSPEQVVHFALKVLGFICLIAALPAIAFLLTESAKKHLNTYRWMLLAIAVSGVAMDTLIALLISPYPLVPHIAFWGDGFLMYIHPRAILYCFAVVLALMYLWLTSLLIAFTYRLRKLVETNKQSQISMLSTAFAVICVFNVALTDFVLLQYPSKEEVERIIREQVPEVMFLFEMPAFIYFVEADNYIFAIIGMAHTVVATVCYVFIFLLVFWKIHVTLSVSKKQMSKMTLVIHRRFIKALIVQMVLPMFLMTAPSLIVAASIKFGSTKNARINYQLISNICLLCVCTHSPINSVAMYLFVVPFRRFVDAGICFTLVEPVTYKKSVSTTQSKKSSNR